jgi:hypothetical protein
MGFFAVLSEAGAHDFAAAKLDINLWCLPGLFSRLVFVCDVGLKLTPTTTPLSNFSLAIPFGTNQNDLEDLSVRLENTRTAGLVFGEPTSLHNVGQTVVLSYGSERLLLGRVELDKCHLEKGQSSENFSLWRIQLATEIPPNQSAYVRLRLPVRRLGRIWNWIPSRFVKRGAVVDVRVADLRESVAIRGGHDYATKIVKIDQLNVFIIVPARLQTHRHSPHLRYARVLEGQVWEHYLGRATDMRRSGKFIVNFWREKAVDSNHEFRGSLSLLTVAARSWFLVLLIVFAGSGMAVALFSDPGVFQRSPAGQAVMWVISLALNHIKTLTLTAVIATSFKFIFKVPKIGGYASALRRWFCRLEHWIYRKRAGF